MKVVIQRVTESDVAIEGKVNGKIEKGFLVLLGIGHEDSETDIEYLANKIVNLRVFKDEQDKMNLSIKDVNGSILLISQFTLYADTSEGNRPSFTNSAKPDVAIPLYDKFINALQTKGVHTETGVFGAYMKVNLVNDGPVTIIIDSKNK